MNVLHQLYLLRSFDASERLALSVIPKLITFYGIKSIKQFKSQIKLIKSESSVNAKLFKQIKTSIKILLQKKKEKIFKMFIDTTKMLYTINKKLKKSIFKMLKENMIISKDINYYLNEVANLILLYH